MVGTSNSAVVGSFPVGPDLPIAFHVGREFAPDPSKGF